MTGHAVGRRTLVVGGSAGLTLGALGLVTAPAHAAGVDTRAQLTAALDRYMATRAGVAGICVRDNRNGQSFFWRPRTQQSHSTIKVLILVATLKVAQDRGRALTSTQKSLASRMIRYSDNAATDTLMRQVGASTCQRVANQLGMTRTVVLGGTVFRSSTWWGHSTTTTRDLVRLMNHVVLGTYLSPGRRAYVRDLMATVTSTQTWGLGDGLPDDVHVELKNGWGPRSDGYRLNCVGHVSGRGRSYQMSILSRSYNGYAYGQTTVNRLSRIVFDALDLPLR
jgi:beta-lactamase class A